MNISEDAKERCDMEAPGTKCELSEHANVLRGVDVFSSLPMERLKLLAFLSKRVSYGEGEFLFRQGDLDPHGYILISGVAEVMREYETHSLILARLQAGDFFGGLALLSNIRRLFSARAVENLDVLRIDRESFQKIMIQFPEMGIRVVDAMIQRITEFEEKLFRTHVHKSVAESRQ